MADETTVVKIASWPEQPAQLEHHFAADRPCPVAISFDRTPANLTLQTTAQEPVHVDMNMNLSATRTIPICVEVCQPICAQSDYTISIDVFDRPVAAIQIRGLTRIFKCEDKA